ELSPRPISSGTTARHRGHPRPRCRRTPAVRANAAPTPPPRSNEMISRRRRSLVLAMALLALVPAAAEALYAPQAGVVSANPADNTPDVLDGMVTAIVPLGNRMIVGGTFSQVQEVGAGKPVLSRHGLFAFDPGTGAVDPAFVPGLDVTTGALDANLNIPFTVPNQGSTPRVETIAVTPDGRTLVAGGNFRSAGGQSRVQIAMVDLSAHPAQLANWQTDRYDVQCSEPGFDSQMRDLDISPDGSYFVVVSTGGYDRNGLCDAAARWETSARGSGLQPTWVDRSRGDSFTAVAATGRAIALRGHVRWLNNNPPNGPPG